MLLCEATLLSFTSPVLLSLSHFVFAAFKLLLFFLIFTYLFSAVLLLVCARLQLHKDTVLRPEDPLRRTSLFGNVSNDCYFYFFM